MSIKPREQPAKEEPRAGGHGLLANGSSPLWDVMVDECLGHEGGYSLELDGPAVCLRLQMRDLTVIPEVIDFLQRHLSAAKSSRPRQRAVEGDSLILGSFNSSPVLLIGDDESPPRCFVVIGPDVKCMLRLTLQQQDVEMVLDALRQVADDLPSEVN